MGGDGALLDKSCKGQYLTPESLVQHRMTVTPASDVCGFAMFCFEILTGSPPFHDTQEEDLVVLVRNGIPPERPQTEISRRWLSDEVWDLLTRCWSQDSMSRPDMSFVVATLRLLQRTRRETSLGPTC